MLHSFPVASDDERPDRVPDPRVCSILVHFWIPSFPGLLTRRRSNDYQLVVKLLEAFVEFYQEVLPLDALSLWFATQVEQHW